MNKLTLGGIAILIVIGGVFLFTRDRAEVPGQSSLGTPAPQTEQRVVVSGHKIQNGNLTVPVGTTVVFENRDNFVGLPYSAHTITTGTIDPSGQSGVAGVVPNSGSGVPDGLIEASLKRGDEFSYTFALPGTVTFYVAEHPLVAGEGMITITAVEEMIINENGNDAGDSVRDGVIEINSVSFSFSPDVLNGKVGEEINIDVTATGQHTFTIDELGVDIVTPHGATTRVSFTPDRAGTFEYYCAIPGHKEAGQVGAIIVSDT